MFDLGFWELLFIGVIALVVLGPERLPVAARTLGRWVGRARAYTRSLSNELDREVHIRELRANMRSAENEFRSEISSTSRTVRELAEDAAGDDARKSDWQIADPAVTPDADETFPPGDRTGTDRAEATDRSDAIEAADPPAPDAPPTADSEDGHRR